MIQIEPYNPDWKTGFDQLKQVFSIKLTGIPVDIQHVGSTAIPGLPAKPILDIDIIIEDKSLLGGISAELVRIGYIDRGDQGIPGRFAFRQQSVYTPVISDRQKWREHHLYVCYADSLALKNHLLIRDALLQDAQLREHYAGLKRQLASTLRMTREEYTRQKTAFILRVLKDLGVNADDLRQINDSNR